MNKRAIYLQLNNILQNRRKDAEAKAASAYAHARENKEFAAADDRLRQLTFELAKAKAFGRDYSALQEQYDKAKSAYDAMLSSLKLDFTPRYSCDICNDSGMADNKPCACSVRIYNELVRKACHLTGVPNSPSMTTSLCLCAARNRTISTSCMQPCASTAINSPHRIPKSYP